MKMDIKKIVNSLYFSTLTKLALNWVTCLWTVERMNLFCGNIKRKLILKKSVDNIEYVEMYVERNKWGTIDV